MMQHYEALQIAFDPIGTHATTTLDLAERVISDNGPSGRDHAAYRQLAALKAEIQRGGPKHWSDLLGQTIG